MFEGATGDFEGDEIVPEEWPTYYTQVPVWVLLSGVSAKAYLMYAFLAEHINNRTPGQRIACPKQTAIARVLALKDDRKVAGYRRELEQLGAIRVSEYRYRGGMRRGYRYVVRFNPPVGYGGLMTLGQFYEEHPDVRSASSEGRARAAGLVLGQRPSAPMEQTGGADLAAPSGRTGRVKPTGGAGTPRLAREVARVLASFPQELRAAMRETARGGAPKTLVAEIERQLQARTVDQLAERVRRRWLVHGYEEKLAAGELRRPVGAAVAMVRAGACADPRCEDGVSLDKEGACPRCEERREDLRRGRLPGGARSERSERVPAQGGERVLAPAWWECRVCGGTGKGAAPADGTCRSCRNAENHGGGVFATSGGGVFATAQRGVDAPLEGGVRATPELDQQESDQAGKDLRLRLGA